MRENTKPLPPTELLRRVLDYNPATGKLYWRHLSKDDFPAELCGNGGLRGEEFVRNLWNAKRGGKEAGEYVKGTGLILRFKNSGRYLAHRVIWALTHGSIPTDLYIDHINGNSLDNRLANLRIVTHETNMRNKKRQPNMAKHPGIYPKGRVWYARIGIGRKRYRHLGYFPSYEEALGARLEAERELGYAKGHGER